jgi:hypothetical protein
MIEDTFPSRGLCLFLRFMEEAIEKICEIAFENGFQINEIALSKEALEELSAKYRHQSKKIHSVINAYQPASQGLVHIVQKP